MEMFETSFQNVSDVFPLLQNELDLRSKQRHKIKQTHEMAPTVPGTLQYSQPVISSSRAECVRLYTSCSGHMSEGVTEPTPISQKLTVFLNRATERGRREGERRTCALPLSVALPALGIRSSFKQL